MQKVKRINAIFEIKFSQKLINTGKHEQLKNFQKRHVLKLIFATNNILNNKNKKNEYEKVKSSIFKRLKFFSHYRMKEQNYILINTFQSFD